MRELSSRANLRPAAPQMSRLEVNGATVIVVEEHSLPVVRFLVALRHGSGHDPEGASGATRLMLELVLRGTEHHTRRELHESLEELGSGLYGAGGHETGLWRGACLSRHLATTFALTNEALTQPSLDEGEHGKLVDETIAELRAARDDDDSLAEIFLRRALYPGHPFVRSPAGEIRDLQHIDTAAVRALYERRLASDELVVGFAGDVTPAQAERLVTELTARLPASLEAELPELPDLPDLSGTRMLVVDKPGRTQTQLRVGRLACDGRSPRALPLWLGTVAFGGTFTSPFTHQVREVRGWSYGANASFDRRRRHRAPFVMRTAPALTDAVDCLALELELFAGLSRGELAGEAIERARSYLLNRYPFQVATAADMLSPAVAGELLGLPLTELRDLPAQLAAVTSDEVHGACRDLLPPENIAAVLVAPASDAVPRLEARFPGAHIDVIDYRDGLEL